MDWPIDEFDSALGDANAFSRLSRGQPTGTQSAFARSAIEEAKRKASGSTYRWWWSGVMK